MYKINEVIKEKLNNITNKKNIIVIILYISLLYKKLIFDINTLNVISKRNIIFDTLIFILLYYIFQILIKNKSIWGLYILLVIISIVMLIDSIFYRCYGNFISIGMFPQLGQLSEVKSSVNFYFNYIDIFYMLDLPVILFFILKLNINELSVQISLKYKFLETFLITLLCLSCFFYVNKKDPGVVYEYSKSHLFDTYGFIGASVIDNFNYLINNVHLDKLDDEKNKIIDDNFKQGNSELLNYKGKNLIMIQVESLQQFVVNRKYQGKEITPNLNKLISDSLYYDNCYYQISIGHTADAELLTNTSLYPLKDSAAYITKDGNEYNALPKTLNSIGYNSFAIHGNEASFWNRNIMYSKYGFNQFYSSEKLKKDNTIDMGLSDQSLFEQSYDIIEKSKKPFYSFIITLSSHSPFTVDNNFCKSDNSLSAYYNSINYTDKQIGTFIDKLKASGILDNSILVIYGDHNAMTISDKNVMSKEVGQDLNNNVIWQEYQKIPLIIKLPNTNNTGIKHDSVGQIDVMPTILDLYGITGVKHFGTDVLDNSNHKVVLRNGSYVEGNKFYNKDNNTTYDIDTGKVLKNEINKINNSEQQLKASDYIINYDYFKNKK